MTKNRIYASVSMIAAFLGVVVVFGLISGLWLNKTSTTDVVFLIPEGFAGDIRVNYNVQGAPALEKEGKYDVIPVRGDGTYDTSQPDMKYGLVTDQYFYVSQDGQRTPIDELCVHVRGNGSSEIGSIITIHNYLSITRTNCSEDFSVWGR